MTASASLTRLARGVLIAATVPLAGCASSTFTSGTAPTEVAGDNQLAASPSSSFSSAPLIAARSMLPEMLTLPGLSSVG